MKNYDYYHQVDETPMLAADAGVEIRVFDLESEDSGRDAAGIMRRRIVRAGVRSWQFFYSTLTEEEYRYTVALLSGKNSFRFSFPGAAGAEERCDAYCPETRAALYDQKLGLYKNLTFQVIEC